MKTAFPALAAAAALALGAGGALAQHGPDHGKMDRAAKGGSHMAMADTEFVSAMQKMHRGMMAVKGGTVDVSFARRMIEHHEGAIAMARIELKHGSDAEAKRMAQKTIDENTKGIAELRDWLRKHGG